MNERAAPHCGREARLTCGLPSCTALVVASPFRGRCGGGVMRFDIPFEVQYLTEGTVPIEDVIDALISAKLFIEEGR
jgi:hypothetical protein